MSDEYEVYLEERPGDGWWAQILKGGVFAKWKSANTAEEALQQASMWIALDSMPRAPVKRYRWDGVSLENGEEITGGYKVAAKLTEVPSDRA